MYNVFTPIMCNISFFTFFLVTWSKFCFKNLIDTLLCPNSPKVSSKSLLQNNLEVDILLSPTENPADFEAFSTK